MLPMVNAMELAQKEETAAAGNGIGTKSEALLGRLKDNAITLGDVPTLCRLVRLYISKNALDTAYALYNTAILRNKECVMELLSDDIHDVLDQWNESLKKKSAADEHHSTSSKQNMTQKIKEYETLIEQSKGDREKQTLAQEALKELSQGIQTEPSKLFLPLFRWCVLTKEPITTAKDLCRSFSNVTFKSATVPRLLFEIMEKWAQADKELRYDLAQVLFKGGDTVHACKLWNKMKDNPLAAWQLLMHESTEKLDAVVPLLHTGLEGISEDAQLAAHNDTKELIRKALLRVEALIDSTMGFLILAGIYATGIPEIVKSDSKKATTLYKAAFNITCDPLKSWTEIWRKLMSISSSETSTPLPQQRLCSQAALMSILEERADEDNLDALILLAEVYADGLRGDAHQILTKENTAKLAALFDKHPSLVTNPSQAQKFFEQTAFYNYLGTEKHFDVQAKINMMLLTLASIEKDKAKRDACVNLYLKQLEFVHESKQAGSQQRVQFLYDSGLIKQGLAYVSSLEEDSTIAAFLACLALEDYEFFKNKDKLRLKDIKECFEQACTIITKVCNNKKNVQEISSIILLPCAEKLYTSLKKYILSDTGNGYHENLKSAKESFGILCILVNKEKVTPSLQEDCQLIAHFPKGTLHLGWILEIMQKHTEKLDTPAQNEKKAEMLYLCAHIALLAEDPLRVFHYLEESLTCLRALSSQHYKEFCQRYHPEKDFADEMVRGKQKVLNFDLWAGKFFFAHYSTLAQAATLEEEKKQLELKATECFKRAFKKDPFTAHVLLGTAYVENTILTQDLSRALFHFMQAFTLKKWNDLRVEVQCICQNTYNSIEKIVTAMPNPSLHEQQLIEQIRLAWHAFSGLSPTLNGAPEKKILFIRV